MALLPPPKGNGFLCHENFMNNRIYMFRGKAATGKASLAHYLGKKYQLLATSFASSVLYFI